MDERVRFRTRNCFLLLLMFYVGLLSSAAVITALQLLLSTLPFVNTVLSVLTPFIGTALFGLLTYSTFRSSARTQLSPYMYTESDLDYLFPKKQLLTELSVTVGLWAALYFAVLRLSPETGRDAVIYMFYLLPFTLPQVLMTGSLTIIFGSFLPSYIIGIIGFSLLLIIWGVGIFCAYFGHKHVAEEIIGLRRTPTVKKKKGKKRKKEPYEDFKKLPHKNYLDD